MLALMDDAGFIIGSYAITFGAIGIYAWRVIARAKRVTAQVPDEAKPWI